MKMTFCRLASLNVFLLFATLVCAQSNYRPGYIITLQNDTVYGEIDYRTDKMNAARCVFRSTGDGGEAITYHPSELRGYRFTDDGRYYVSKSVFLQEEAQPFFLEYLLKGIKSLYYLETGDELPVYFIEDGGKLVKVDAPQLSNQAVNFQFKGQKDRYIPVLHYVFRDCPQLSSRIDNLRFSRTDIVKLARDYHYAMCTSNEDCIEFEAKEANHSIQLHFTFYGGIIQYTVPSAPSYLSRKSDMSYLVGVGMTIGSKRWMSSLSGCVDLSLSRLVITENQESMHEGMERSLIKNTGTMLSGKLGIRYTYPKGMVRPFAEFGADISTLISGQSEYHGKKEDWQEGIFPGYYVNVGMNIKLSRKSERHMLYVRAQFKDIRDMIEKARFVSGWSGAIGYTF